MLTEDVYYMHLLFKQLRHQPLTILHLTLSEYVVERGNRALHYASVYHKLKKPDRWEYIRKRPFLLQPAVSADGSIGGAPPLCHPMTQKYRIRRRGQLVAKLDHCCEQWTWCELPQAVQSRRRAQAHVHLH